MNNNKAHCFNRIYFEILQLEAMFKASMASCWGFIMGDKFKPQQEGMSRKPLT